MMVRFSYPVMAKFREVRTDVAMPICCGGHPQGAWRQMNTYVRLGLVVALSGWLSACGKPDSSPVIVCMLDGRIVPTAFTFASFERTVAAEHGQVTVESNKCIKSRSLEVHFKRLPDGRLLAENLVWNAPGREMSPAAFFGLTNSGTRVGIDTRPVP